jgi:tetratricopeptide (TPR) repeat protein
MPELGVATRSRDEWIAAALVFVVVTLVFARVVQNGWLEYDDKYHVIDNPHFRVLGWSSVAEHWREPYGNLYIPVAYTVFALLGMLTRAVSGAETAQLSPLAFHVAQVVLHAVSGVLTLRLLRRLGFPLLASVIGALVFALHPLQAESVAWLSELRGNLATVFTLGALNVHLTAVREDDVRGRRVRWDVFAGAVGLFVLALLSKPSVIAMPLAFVAVDVYRRGEWKVAVIRALPYVVMSFVMLIVTQQLQSGSAVRHPAPVVWRPLIAMDALGFYLWKLVWPLALCPDYARTPAMVIGSPRTVGVATAIAAPIVITAVVLMLRRRSAMRVMLLALALGIAALAPVLGLVTFDHQNISTVADRYASLALLGVAVLVAAFIGRAWSIGARRCVFAGAVLVAGLLSIRTFDQIRYWRDDETLWTRSLEICPDGTAANNNLGFCLAARGKHAEAILHFVRALEVDPEIGRAQVNLGWSLLEVGRTDEAVEPLERGVELLPRMARAHAGLALARARQNRMAEAVAGFRRAVELDTESAEHRSNLGLALMGTGDLAGAEAELSKAADLKPDLPSARFNLGILFERLGRRADAAAAFDKAAELDPTLVDAWLHLGDNALAMRQFAEAERAYRRALGMRPVNAPAEFNLGQSLRAQGRTDEALAAFRRAVMIDPKHRPSVEAIEAMRSGRTP